MSLTKTKVIDLVDELGMVRRSKKELEKYEAELKEELFKRFSRRKGISINGQYFDAIKQPGSQKRLDEAGLATEVGWEVINKHKKDKPYIQILTPEHKG